MGYKSKGRRIVNIAVIALVILIIVIGVYLYLFVSSYSRQPEQVYLETETTGAYSYFEDSETINTDRYYNIATYNIAYGANTPEFSSFFDGGSESRATSDDHLLANMCSITDVINRMGVDFMLLQEVDVDSDRAYHINELEIVNQFFKGYYYNAGECWDTSYVFFPLRHPMGAAKSVQVTYSKSPIAEGIRKSLPVTESQWKLLDMDRCYVVTRIPTANEKMLVIYNVALSRIGSSNELRRKQISLLMADMENEYKSGNYVICGGDFACSLKDIAENSFSWSEAFPRDLIPEGFSIPMDKALPSNISPDTCRSTRKAYVEGETFTATTDGFIVSDNIKVHYYNHCYSGYLYSSHDPVLMQIFLKP